MYTSTNMGLTVWNLLTDLFDHTQLENNFAAIDQHDHTEGRGVQIPTGGIADGAITDSKVAAGTLTVDRFAAGQFLAPPYAFDSNPGAQTATGGSWQAGATSVQLTIHGPQLVFIYAESSILMTTNGVFGYVGLGGTDFVVPQGLMSTNRNTLTVTVDGPDSTMSTATQPAFADHASGSFVSDYIGVQKASRQGNALTYFTASSSYPAVKTWTLFHHGGGDTITASFEKLWVWGLGLTGSTP